MTSDNLENRIEYDPDVDAYRLVHDWAGPTPPSTTIVEAISALSGHGVASLEPLSSTVDPDALDAIFRARPDGTPRTGGTVAFVHEGFEVEFHGEGEVLVRPPE